jgi:DNA-binding response OmpR family regulator
MSKILIVEDQLLLLSAVRRGLEAEGYQVAGATTCDEARREILTNPPDAVILDLLLPDGNGLDLLNEVRTAGFKQPVIIVSAQNTVDQRISGLDRGADDYLVKPFNFAELLARLRAHLRRNPVDPGTVLTCDDLKLDLLSRIATRAGELIELTTRQFDMLAYLLRHKHEVVTRERLALDVWRNESTTWSNVIEVQINRIRNKIQGKGQRPLLHTIRGQGYSVGELPL